MDAVGTLALLDGGLGVALGDSRSGGVQGRDERPGGLSVLVDIADVDAIGETLWRGCQLHSNIACVDVGGGEGTSGMERRSQGGEDGNE